MVVVDGRQMVSYSALSTEFRSPIADEGGMARDGLTSQRPLYRWQAEERSCAICQGQEEHKKLTFLHCSPTNLS